jgi:hypothetical protein
MRPYQPSLLRLLHGSMLLLVPAAWLSGLMVYCRHDGRWGALGWAPAGDWIDIHGTLAVLIWPLALLFGVYALSLGRARLRRAANAAPLLALALAVGSGKLMDENWLRDGQLHQPVYSLHLLAWLMIAGSVLWHAIVVLRRGGTALAASMLRPELRTGDQPQHWPGQLIGWWRRGR